jgi:2-polyprenyl-6-methoxyphenol hydroxylase-like FAD-dependent oxidoreductase
VLRRALGGAAPRPFPYGAIWATVPDLGLSDGALSQQYAQARIMIGYLPIGRQTAEGPPLAAFFWSLKPELYGAWHAGFETWLDKAARLWPAMRPVLEGFSGPDDLSLASYAHYTARRPVKGRLVAIGDAGHSTSPQLGQGANNGLIDAVVLHDALARETDLDAALALFAKTRHGHVRFYQWASRLMTPYFQSDSVALSTLRDLTFARLKLVPYTHREMIRTLAGLKTGPFTWAPAERIVNALAAREASP